MLVNIPVLQKENVQAIDDPHDQPGAGRLHEHCHYSPHEHEHQYHWFCQYPLP